MTGNEFRRLRESMGWSQYFLADVLGVPRARVAHWEHDRSSVPFDVALAMRKAFVTVNGAIGRLSRSS